ncbi:MAG: hypothetical protein C0624_08935 [Desulfuromonas sp.]|nr:MAG: hypothetical protein C0624_08935 [Desulfuromonas sp.]
MKATTGSPFLCLVLKGNANKSGAGGSPGVVLPGDSKAMRFAGGVGMSLKDRGVAAPHAALLFCCAPKE